MGLPSHGHVDGQTSGVFRSGDVLDGRYRIEHVIAEGGVAIVVAAEQLGLDRHVAIKLLRPETLGDRQLVEHFKSEGSLAAKIKSEHVVRIHDVGEGPGIGPYMVMELLEGHDLEQRLASGPLAVEEAVDYVVQACDALAEAHHLRIVHRDIKPANLFIASRPPRAPILKIIDFGISKLVPRTVDGPSADLVAGTPAYMSPEQILHGQVVDARADIWALGVVLFELLTGQLPFPMQEPQQMLETICSAAPMRLRALRPDLPQALDDVIARCLARDPTHRWGTAVELAAALEPFRGARDPLKSSGEVEIAHAYTNPRRQAETVVFEEPTRSSRKVLIVASALITLAAIGAGLIVIATSSTPAKTTEETVATPAASAEPPVEATAPVAPAPSADVASATTAAPSATATATAKPRPVVPSKTKPAAPKAGASPAGDRSMFGERK